MNYLNNDNRLKLIDEIFKQGRVFDSLAQSTSVSAIRKNCKDKNLLEDAARYVAINDSRNEMATKLVDFVNAFWPKAEAF